METLTPLSDAPKVMDVIKPSFMQRINTQIPCIDTEKALGIMSLLIVAVSSMITVNMKCMKDYRKYHMIGGILSVLLVAVVWNKFDATKAIMTSLGFAAIMLLHFAFCAKKSIVIPVAEKVEAPQPAPKSDVPPKQAAKEEKFTNYYEYESTEPIAAMPEDEVQSLCGHLKSKDTMEEIVTSADFSELVNAEQACSFAKHQYVPLAPITAKSTNEVVGNEENDIHDAEL